MSLMSSSSLSLDTRFNVWSEEAQVVSRKCALDLRPFRIAGEGQHGPEAVLFFVILLCSTVHLNKVGKALVFSTNRLLIFTDPVEPIAFHCTAGIKHVLQKQLLAAVQDIEGRSNTRDAFLRDKCRLCLATGDVDRA